MEAIKIDMNSVLAAAGLMSITVDEYNNMLLMIGRQAEQISRQNEEIKALEYRITTLLRP